MLYGIPLSISSTKSIRHLSLLLLLSLKTTGARWLFALFYITRFPLFCLSLCEHAFWQSHKMELETSKKKRCHYNVFFRDKFPCNGANMFHIFILLLLLLFFLRPPLSHGSHFAFSALTLFYLTLQNIFSPDQISQAIRAISGELQKCFPKQYICTHVWAHPRACVCVCLSSTSICQENLFNFI